MIKKCCCTTCSHYDDEMCMREEESPVGTAPDDWCLGWKEKKDGIAGTEECNP